MKKKGKFNVFFHQHDWYILQLIIFIHFHPLFLTFISSAEPLAYMSSSLISSQRMTMIMEMQTKTYMSSSNQVLFPFLNVDLQNLQRMFYEFACVFYACDM